MANIRKLKDSNGEDIYPITFTDAVYTNDGRTIEDIINQMSTVDQQITQYENNNSQIRESIINLLEKHGINYNGSDSLTTLIGKIPVGAGGSTESNGNNGLQYATGSMGLDVRLYDGETFKRETVSLDEELPFTPSIIFIRISEISEDISSSSSLGYKNLVISTEFPFTSNYFTSNEITIVPKEKSFDIKFYSPEENEGIYTYTGATCNWYAFGESESSSEGGSTGGAGLNIISASSLPASGEENQICVITDNPIDNYVVTSNLNDNANEDSITLYNVSDSTSMTPIVISSNGVTSYNYITQVCQGSTNLASYVYYTGQWTPLTLAGHYLLKDGTLVTGPMSDKFGTFPSGYLAGTGLKIPIDSSSYYVNIMACDKSVDFSSLNFSKIKVTAYTSNAQLLPYLYVVASSQVGQLKSSSMTNISNYLYSQSSIHASYGATKHTYELDINWSSQTGYLGIGGTWSGTGTGNLYITDIEFE